jgi:NAD+ synthase
MDEQFYPEATIETIKSFLAGKLSQSGLKGYVVGLSGGIDSAVSASLAVEAVGSTRVFAVLMPYRTTAGASVKDATELVDELGIEHKVVDISPMIDAYYPEVSGSVRVRAGNKMARERMSILFDIAHEKNRLVLGTGNRTEICLGYTTWFGDSACSLNPIGELYKTEIRVMAKQLGVPASIVNKVPSADLWAGQTDEGEIGVTYEEIDRLLRMIIDDGERSMEKLLREGFEERSVNRVISLINANAFKRRMPEVASLGKPAVPDNIQLTSS